MTGRSPPALGEFLRARRPLDAPAGAWLVGDEAAEELERRWPWTAG